MALVPSPYSYVSTPLYNIWPESKKFIPNVKLGGFFANKRGYHNTRLNNQRLWPKDYSIRLSADLEGSNSLASAADLTMSTVEMIKRTRYLMSSALNSKDWRLYQLREFIGTLNGSTVYCRIASDSHGLGQLRGVNDWGRDKTHLWHIHLSILRRYANSWKDILPLLSVLKGQSLADFEKRDDVLVGLRKGDTGNAVLQLQTMLAEAGFSTGGYDGIYGDKTAAAVLACNKSVGSNADGDSISHWAYRAILRAVILKNAVPGPKGEKGDPGDLRIPETVTISGTVKVKP